MTMTISYPGTTLEPIRLRGLSQSEVNHQITYASKILNQLHLAAIRVQITVQD